MRTVSFNRFDGGIVSDPRSPAENVCRFVQHFDVFSNPHKMTPYRSFEDGDSSSSTNLIQNFAYDGTTVFGFGTGGTNVRIFSRTNFTDAIWSSFNIVGGTRDSTNFFTYYKTTGKIYGVQGARYVWSLTISGPSSNSTAFDLGASAYTTTSNGLVHSKDDILYFGYDNKIASNNNDTWTAVALTLPASMTIMSLSEYGNYLAIACKEKTGLRSVVYLWDRDSSNATLSETIDWGEGNIYALEQIEGYLVGVSFEGTSGSYNVNARMVCRYYSPSLGAVKFAEVIGFSQSPAVQGAAYKAKIHNRLLFPAAMAVGSTGYFGIWSIGRALNGAPFGLVLDRVYRTAFSSSLTLYGVIQLGDYVFGAYSINSTTYMDKTDDTAAYTTTSVYETTINPELPERIRGAAGLRTVNKSLSAVALSYEPLPSGGSVTLKYRVDSNGGAWTTIFTETTAGTVTTERVRIADGTAFTSGREYEFRIESTGGAEVTELKYRVEELNTLI